MPALTVRFDGDDHPTLLRRFKMVCARDGLLMADVVRGLVEDWTEAKAPRRQAAVVGAAPGPVVGGDGCAHPADAFDATTGRCAQCGEDVG